MKFVYTGGTRPLDGFTLLRGLGRGGFGEVYLAVTEAGKEVALKLVQRSLDTELRGVRTCLNLKHPNLVEIYDIREDSKGDTWIVMEYVAGERLEDVLDKARGPLPEAEVRAWLDGVLAGLAHLHDRGIVHRDIKPGNLFREDGLVKVGDYGLSKFLTASRRSGQTETIGTIHYMAPEVCRGKYGCEIDLYAVGVILYEMLTGRRAFDGESVAEILMKHLTATPDLAAVPTPYRAAVAGCLEKDPAKRIGSTAALRERLPPLGGAAVSYALPAPGSAPATLPRGDAATPAVRRRGEEPTLTSAPGDIPTPRQAASPAAAPAAHIPPPHHAGGPAMQPAPPHSPTGSQRPIYRHAAQPAEPFTTYPPARPAEPIFDGSREPLAQLVVIGWHRAENYPLVKAAVCAGAVLSFFFLGKLWWMLFWAYIVYWIAWEILHGILGRPEPAPRVPPPSPPMPPRGASRPNDPLREREALERRLDRSPTRIYPPKSAARKWDELCGSWLSAIFFATGLGLAWSAVGWFLTGAAARPELVPLTVVSVLISSLSILALGKVFDCAAPTWSGRFAFSALGLGLGFVLAVLADWLGGRSTAELASRLDDQTASFVMVYGVLYFLIGWQKQVDPLRQTRFALFPLLTATGLAYCLQNGLRAGVPADTILLTSVTVQLAAVHQRREWFEWVLRSYRL